MPKPGSVEPGTDSAGEYIAGDMLTRSGAASVHRRRDAAAGTIELLKQRTEVLELKENLTEDDRQSALRMSGLLGNVTAQTLRNSTLL